MNRGLVWRILATALLLTIALIGLILRENRLRDTGREAILSIDAVDPRDLLTGHYVALRISEARPDLAVCPKGLPTAATPGLMRLAPGPDGRHHLVTGPKVRGELKVTGFADCQDTALSERVPAVPGSSALAAPPIVTLDIGVDRYHADQDEAEAIDKVLRNRNPGSAAIVISVGPDHRARLKGLILNGKRTDITWN